ncbi:6-pyruvoyl trahydropterin synthase family protein [Caldiplasma sukawensis]
MTTVSIRGWEANIKFSSAHFIPGHNKCKRLHGHDYAVDITISGEISNGMVYDFVELKRILREIVEYYDHKLILPKRSRDMKFYQFEESVKINYEEGEIILPLKFVAWSDVEHTSSEEMIEEILQKTLQNIDKKGIEKLSMSLWEGPGQYSSVEKIL